MNDFNIIDIENEEFNILILMMTCDSPFDYITEIAEQLNNKQFKGSVIIDEMLHSGNSDERFITGYFDGVAFDENSFRFLTVPARSDLRQPMCTYLASDLDVLNYSILTIRQQKLISKGCYL